jgi:hypothetical protein
MARACMRRVGEVRRSEVNRKISFRKQHFSIDFLEVGCPTIYKAYHW